MFLCLSWFFVGGCIYYLLYISLLQWLGIQRFFVCWQFPFWGHLGFILQLKVIFFSFIVYYRFSYLLYIFRATLSFCAFLLNILSSLFNTGNCLKYSFIDIFPTLVFTFLLYGGLSEIMFLFLFRCFLLW